MKDKNIENIFPMTPLQEGLLYHTLRSEDKEAYVEQMSIELAGKVDEALIRKSIEKIVERYDILRAVIVHEKTPRPLHVIKKKTETVLNVHSLKTLNESEKNNKIEDLKASDTKRGFDLVKGPLLRLMLIWLNEDKCLLVFTYHHIIMDGWSLAIVINEFYQNYLAFVDNKENHKSSPPQFNTYLRFLESLDQDKAMDYWRNYLNGYDTIASFATGSSLKEEFDYDVHSFHLDNKAVRGIEKLMDQYGVTFPTAMQFLWGIMLARLTDRQDVVFGTIVSGRSVDIERIDDMVGMLINTIPVRLQFDQNSTLNKVLISHNEALIKGVNYQYCSLSSVQKECGIPELFDQLLVFENYPYEDLGQDERLRSGNITVLEKTSYRFLVNMTFGTGVEVRISYDESNYPYEMVRQIEKIINHLSATIPEICSERSLTSIDLLPDEIKNTLKKLNQTDHSLPSETLVSLFSKGLNRFANNIAVVDEKESWTWSELDRYSFALAERLLELGVKPEEPVPVLIYRSNYMMAALLGILRSGAAYLPLDPSLPDVRQQFIMRDSNARFLVKMSGKQTGKDWMKDFITIDVDQIQPVTDRTFKAPAIKPDQLAYIIYTSGSTGEPKGVMVEHRSVNNRLQWMQRKIPLNSKDRLIQKTNYAFDVSVWELFGWMFEGASLYFLNKDEEKDPDQIFEQLVSKKITRVHFVPSMLSVFLEHVSAFKAPQDLSHIQYFFSSGERLDEDLAERFNQLINKNTGATLVNLYGPTEAAIEVTSFVCPEAENIDSVPIGKPIDNTKIHIVDKQMNILPPEFTGEICIEGIQVARAYLNQPELTKERFIESPFHTGQRIYRTGDIGKWQSDGEVICLGRNDNQVKIRGYRIELNEVNAALRSINGVEYSAVLVNEKNNEKTLIAFCSGKDLNSEVLNTTAAGLLPSYMLPARYHILPSWPVQPSGKTDIKALEKLLNDPDTPEAKLKIQNRNEELAAIWKELLSLERIDPEDDFFELGGHSLLAIRLAARIQKHLSVKVTIKEIFSHSEFNELEKLIASKKTDTVAVITKYEGQDIPMTGAQKRLFILYQLFEQDTAYHIPGAWELKMPIDKDRFENAVRKVMDKHQILRTGFVFDEEEGTFRQIINDLTQANITYERVEGIQKSQEAFTRKVLAGFIRPFNLQKSPLFRLKLVSYNDHEHLLLFDVHHIIFDGPSFNLFFNDLLDCYYNRKQTPLNIQYKDFAHYIDKQLNEAALNTHRTFWLKQFKPGIPQLDFPDARERKSLKNRQGRVKSTVINKHLKSKLSAFATEHQLTLNQLLLGAFVLLLIKKSKQHQVVVGTVVSGRLNEETEKMIGMFANTLAIPFYNETGWKLTRFLTYIKEQLLSSMDHQLYPFDKLVDELNPQRDTTRSPLFDVLYSMERVQSSGQDIEETLIPVQLTEKPVSYDLSFFVNEYPEQLNIYLEYDTGLFSDEWAGEMLEEWISIIDHLPESMDLSLFEFCNLDETDQVVKSKIEHRTAVSVNNSTTDILESSLSKQVKEVWSALLNKEISTGNENFFAEGGHSIMAVRLSLLVQRKTGVKLPVMQIFRQPVFKDVITYLLNSGEQENDKIKLLPKAPYYELSAAQMRLWITHELNEQKQSYNVASAYSLKGDLNIKRLKNSFEKIISEHEMLRSYYDTVDGNPKMFIKESLPVEWNEYDLTNESDPEKVADLICKKAFNCEFDLKKPPLFQIYLIKTESNHYRLCLFIHHMITDGWSMNILVNSLVRKYNGVDQVKTFGIDYKDFAAWHNRKLNGSYGKKLQKYWENRFGEPLKTNPPHSDNGDHSRSAAKIFFLTPEDTSKLTSLAVKNDWSRYQLLLGSLGSILCNRGKSKEQIILLSDAGRSHPDVNDIFGFFINTLPFRYRLHKNERMKDMINRVKEELISDLEHSSYSLDNILKEIKKVNRFTNDQLLNVRLIYNDFDHGKGFEMNGIAAEEKRIETGAGKFDLSITAGPVRDRLCIQMEYNRNIYEEQDLDRIYKSWMKLIRQIEECPDETTGEGLDQVLKSSSATSASGLEQLKNIKIESFKITDNEK